jgi:amino acid adenylation domain-containing protein
MSNRIACGTGEIESHGLLYCSQANSDVCDGRQFAAGQQGEITLRGPGRMPQTAIDLANSDGTVRPAHFNLKEVDHPLSFAQQRIWFIDQLELGGAKHNIGAAFWVTGALATEVLEDSVRETVRRHQALRTTFLTRDGQPIQFVGSTDFYRVARVDLRGLSQIDTAAEARRLAKEEAGRPIELARGPLFRITLLQCAAEEHLLLVTMHRMICDVWSLGVFSQELWALYAAFAGGRPSPLPELTFQYADYAAWQRGFLQGAVFEKELAYWEKQLAGAPRLLELPTDRPRPRVQSYRGASLQFCLPRDLAKALQALSKHEGTDLFTTLMAAFQVLLGRYSRQDEFIVSTAVPNRNHPGTEGLIGCLANVLLLRANISGNPTFRELLGRVRETTLAAHAHQDLPFEELVRALRPERDLSCNPLAQVMLTLSNDRTEWSQLAGVNVTRLDLDIATSPYDLVMQITQTGDALAGVCRWATDLFDEGTIRRLLGNWQVLLGGLVAEPDCPVRNLPLLTEAERRQAMVEWNATQTDYPLDRCLHQWFEEQVERTPDAVAIVAEGHGLTYREFNARANQLARFLLRQGVGPGVLVGVCAERSVQMVLALYGVLKAGAAYVPLEPTLPKERLAFMLEDTKVPIVLTQEHLRATLPQNRAKVINLDLDWHEMAAEDAANPMTTVSPGDPAYVIYTSGSTGRPKGACNTHRGICNRLLWMQDAYRLTAEDRVLQKTPFGFDVSVWEFFWPLMQGACLVVARPEGHRDRDYLVQLVCQAGITTVHFVPSMLAIFLEAPGVEKCKSLRRVICSGEALPVEYQDRFFARLPFVELHNLYGPTEASVDVSCWRCLPEPNQRTVPIGRPIANMQLYILDELHQPVPVGVPGELYIGGVGLAQGYINRPELTAEKFIPNPFAGLPSERLYKTGDLVRYRADGNIEFLGRIDFQVKIRGCRIELGEIETVLTGHPGVREAVVLAREDKVADKRLVAYVVVEEQQQAPVGELRSYLQERLPDYMIPSAFVFLGALPLTASGKVDRRALPAPVTDGLGTPENFTAARTPIEMKVAALWTEVLGLKRVGIHQSFFDLGGHSLLAVRLFVQIEKAFGIRLPIGTLFEGPTIAQLAKVLDKPAQSKQRMELVPLQTQGSKPPLFFLPSLGEEIFYCRPIVRHLGSDQPIYGIQPRDSKEWAPEFVPLEEMARRFAERFCALYPQGPFHLAGYSFGGKMAFEMARQLWAMGRKVRVLAIIDTDLPRAPDKSLRGLVRNTLGFARNLPYWFIDDLLHTPPKAILSRIWWYLRRFRPGRGAGVNDEFRVAKGPQLEDFFDISRLPDHYLQLMAANLRASCEYVPKAFPGRVTLFRSRTRPLFRSHDLDLGWGRWAQAGVDIRTVPGHHGNIVKEPAVATLAQLLKDALDRAG